MINISEIDKNAIERAEKELKRGFNSQAYIVYKLAKMDNKTSDDNGIKDFVVDSSIDENIQEMLDNYVKYSDCKKMYRKNETAESKESMIDYLNNMLDNYINIIAEMWSCTDCEEERRYLQTFADKLKSY